MAQDITDLMTLRGAISDELQRLDDVRESVRVQSFRTDLQSVVQELLAAGREPTDIAVRDRLIALGHTDWVAEAISGSEVMVR